MRAVVMAGGAGSRLRPLTIARPKPMLPILERPALEHILNLLKANGFSEVMITLQYMAPVIENYFGDGETFGMSVHYSVEGSPLGTAGSVRRVADWLAGEPFLVISGDALTDFDLQGLVNFHRDHSAAATLALYHVPNPLEYGIVVTDGEGRITRFVEKPTWGEVLSDTVNTGVYVLDPSVLESIPPNVSFDFSHDLFPLLLDSGMPLFGYVPAGYWCDIGDHASYAQANADVLAGRVRGIGMGEHLGDGIWVGGSTEIAHDAQLLGPLYLGRGVKIKGGVVVRGPSVIGDDTILDSRAHVDRAIIWRNSYIGEDVEVRGAIIGRQCRVKLMAVLYEGAVLGDGCIVGERAVIHPNVRLWPEKEVEPGAIVRSSIIWGTHARRVIFGRYGVTGLVNVDMTPEFAARLGAAFGAMHETGATVTVNRDLNKTSRMIKRAIIAGLPSAGINALDLVNVPVPVARYYTRSVKAAGGVHVRLSPYDRRVVDIKFFDQDGLTISHGVERAIERAFFREDFRRVYLDEIGNMSEVTDAIDRYRARMLEVLNAGALRARKFSLAVDYAHAPVSLVLPPLFEQLGCQVVTLNSYLDPDRMSIDRQDFESGLQRLASITGAIGADFGVRFDVSGERIFVVGGSGERVSDTDFALLMSDLCLRGSLGKRLIVPANASWAIERIAQLHQAQVVRTRMDPTSLMAAATGTDVIMGTDGTGHFIFPEFHGAVDGLFAVLKFMEVLALQDTTLSNVLAQLPPHAVVHTIVDCPWDAKGRLMRRLGEKFPAQRTAQTDGYRIVEPNGWALIQPDPDNPVCNVYAEAETAAESQSLAERMADTVAKLVAE